MGQKITKTVRPQGASNLITNYLDGFQYVDAVLQFFPHAEGYVKRETTGAYTYVFNHTDHLGNVRLSYSDLNKDNSLTANEILEENNYYPFGLKHANYNTNNTQPGYKYKYNGKEFQDELGLNMYDYGARNYDGALGRWMNVDPLAELSRRWSPYTYCYNNPIRFIDPDGMYSTEEWKKDNGVKDSDLTTIYQAPSSENESHSNGPGDPPTTSSISDFFKSLFNMTPKSEEEAEQSNTDRDFFTKATDLMIEVGDSYLTAMMLIFPLPSNPSSEIKATGWIVRKVYNSLDSTLQKKFVEAIGKGIVAPTGKQGIIRLTASEAKSIGGGYTHKLKILAKGGGGDMRIFGKQLPNGHFVFDFLKRH